MKPKTDKAVIYARFSPRRNAADCESIDTQIDYCTNYCLFNGWEVLAIHQDAGISGAKTDNRPGLQAAIEQAAKTRAVLVFYSLSRLARSTKDALEIAERLSRAKANLCSVTEKLDTTSPYGKFFFVMAAAIAELDRTSKAEITSNAMHYHQQNGRKMSSKCPFGWSDDPNDPARMIPNARELAIIEEIKVLRDAGDSFRTIAGTLAKRGHAPRTQKKCIEGREIQLKGSWSFSTIRNICHRIEAGRC